MSYNSIDSCPNLAQSLPFPASAGTPAEFDTKLARVKVSELWRPIIIRWSGPNCLVACLLCLE